MYILSFDIGGTSIKYGVLDENAKIYEKGKVKTPQEDIDLLIAEIKKIAVEMKKNYRLTGIALSCPGEVDDDHGIIEGASAVPCIHCPDFKEKIKVATGVENIKMENDGNSAALAEVWKGAAKDNNDAVFFIVGSGVGGAIIKDRKIHKGANLQGGEFGYMVVSEEYATLSEAASPVHLAKRVALRKGLQVGSIDGEDVWRLAAEGDGIAMEEMDKFYYYIAAGIYNLQYIFDPEIIVLGGGISSRIDILENIEKGIDKIMKRVCIAKIKPNLQKCEFLNDANLIGAVYNFISKTV